MAGRLIWRASELLYQPTPLKVAPLWRYLEVRRMRPVK